MDIVSFSTKTWQEIPEQDNPAMYCNMIKDQNNHGALIHPECVMIFKGKTGYFKMTDGGFVVARVPKEGDIILLGAFWRIEIAEAFAEMIACPNSAKEST